MLAKLMLYSLLQRREDMTKSRHLAAGLALAVAMTAITAVGVATAGPAAASVDGYMYFGAPHTGKGPVKGSRPLKIRHGGIVTHISK
jgi:hypothetical protein